jgi:CDP-2,3-bis-(O-geranylgeranyl)-sn-glycerol synthase
MIILVFLYVVPLYIANSSPVIAHGKVPLDFGKKLFGQPILGKGKTVLGTVAGITIGTGTGAIILLFFPQAEQLIPNYLQLAFLLAFGAIIGDVTKSFFKRRFSIKSGEKWDLADQLDFVLGGLLVSMLLRIPEVWLVVLLLIATFFIHKTFNWVAYKLKLKEVPW